MKYKCNNCKTIQEKLVFEFKSYETCVATNSDDPEYQGTAPSDFEPENFDSEIGDPVGCLNCKAMGIGIFEKVEVK